MLGEVLAVMADPFLPSFTTFTRKPFSHSGGVWTATQAFQARAGTTWLSAAPQQGHRQVNAGGYTGSTHVTTIDYTNIPSAAAGKDFADLTVIKGDMRASSQGRGKMSFAGGYSSGGGSFNVIEYFTTAVGGTCLDGGDLHTAGFSGGSCSDGTLAVLSSYSDSSDDIQYYSLATMVNTEDWGDLTANGYIRCGTNHPVRGIFSGGRQPSNVHIDHINRITFASKADAVSYGSLAAAKMSSGSAENGKESLVCGGEGPSGMTNTMDILQIMTDGDVSVGSTITEPTNYMVMGSHNDKATWQAVHSGYASGNNIYTLNMATRVTADSGNDLSQARGAGHGTSGE